MRPAKPLRPAVTVSNFTKFCTLPDCCQTIALPPETAEIRAFANEDLRSTTPQSTPFVSPTQPAQP